MVRSTGSIRGDDLRPRNRAAVIAALRAAPRLSRTALAERTKLSPSTISAIAADLLNEGVLRESQVADPVTGRRGRPQVALELNPNAARVVTAVLSLNRFSAALVDYAGGLVVEDTVHLETGALSQGDLIAAVMNGLTRVMEQKPLPSAPVLRIAVAIQGVTDAEARTLLWSPITSGGDIPFADLLEDRFGIPVTVENDCNMMAFALRWRDPDRYRDNFIALLLSHGIGMGLMLRGEVFHGTRSSAGEFGHMNHMPGGALCRCGRRGCIEAYGGNYAIARRAGGLSPDRMPDEAADDVSMEALIAAAREHDGPERTAFTEAGTAIGFGIGSLFALIDPAPVAVAGTGAAAFDLLEPAIQAAVAQTAGGQHSSAVSFTVEGDEMPLIQQGCAMHALTTVDRSIVAPGQSLAALLPAKELEAIPR